MKKMLFSNLECNPNDTAFSAPGLTMHQAAAALAFYYFCFQIRKLLSNICFQRGFSLQIFAFKSTITVGLVVLLSCFCWIVMGDE